MRDGMEGKPRIRGIEKDIVRWKKYHVKIEEEKEI